MARTQIRTDIVAQDKTKKAFASVNRAMKSLKKGALGIGIAVGAIGAAFIAAAKKAVNFADEIAKTADMVGISTNALQELRVATDLAGISQGQLDSALGALSKRMGELRHNTGTMNTFLNKSDPQFKTLLQNTTSNEQAFRLIIGRLDTMTNAQDKAALSAAAFGRTAGIAISKLSLKEIDAGIDRARKLGLVIDENLLRNAESIKDEFTLASKVIQVQFMQSVLRIMREVDFSTLASDVAEIAKNFIQGAINAAKFFGVIERSEIEKKTRELAALEKKIADINAVLNAGGRRGMNDTSMSNALATAQQRAAELNAEIEKLKKPIALPEITNPAAQRTQRPLAVTITPPTETELGIFKMEEFMDDVSAFTNDFEFELEQATEISKAMATDVDADMKKLAASFKLPKTPLEELANQSRDTFGQLQDIGTRAMQGIEDSIVGLVDGTKSLKDAFRQMASSIISDLLRMQIKQHITGPLSGLLSSGLGSLFGGGSTFASGFAGAPALGFADGGYAAGGRPAIVGERGPELIVPGRRGATVFPNESLGGNVTINQSFDFSGANPATVQLLRQESQRIKAETFSSVFQAIDRGGNFAKISGRR